MPLREDGHRSRQRLLEAACILFSEKGYRATRVKDICRRAGTNAASVNYYFGDKASLYVAAWRRSFEKGAPADPGQRTADRTKSPEDHLSEHIHHMVMEFSNRGKIGQFNRLYLMEMINPTGLIDAIWQEMVTPRRQRLLAIIRAIIGPQASQETLYFCEMSVINQCRIFLTLTPKALEFLFGQPLSAGLTERIADHITRFSISGMNAMTRAPAAGAEEHQGSSPAT